MQRPNPADLPLCPGVYIYKDAVGRIIYVGKAAVLRRRVLSYFRASGLAPRTEALMRRAASLETLPTSTEKEALLLEATLIKKHRPRYNIVLRDDKSHLLFRLDRSRDFPRLELVRTAVPRDKARYFGPLVSALAARRTRKAVLAVFPLRRCSDRAMRQRSRPCLYYDLRRCSAPCVGHISREEYARLADHVEALLSGKSRELLTRLENEMQTAAEAWKFERAAELRDRIQAVRQSLEHQAAVLPGNEELDAVVPAQLENGLGLGILFVRNGALIGGRGFFWPGLEAEDEETLDAFFAQFYNEGNIPPRIVLPCASIKNDAASQRPPYALRESVLAELRGAPVTIRPARGADERRLIETARLYAKEEAGKRRSPPQALAAALHLAAPPERIECVDVSHSSGAATRVGLVVFEDGKALPSAFRIYTVRDTGGDDHAALRAWLPRRLESGPPWPDLLLVDGGRGQLATIRRALEEAGQTDIFPLAAIAKAREGGEVDRRAGGDADRIFLPERVNPLPLKAGSPELLFLQNIRDHAHRFALRAHRKARSKESFE